MASVASRSCLPYWGSLVQSISGPLSPDTGYISKVSGILYQDNASSKPNHPISRALGTVPRGMEYGLTPFGHSLASKYKYGPYFNENMAPGPTQFFQDTSPPGHLRSIRHKGGTGYGLRIPEELAFITLQSSNPMYTKRYTLYHHLALNWYRGNLYRTRGSAFKSPAPPSKAYHGDSFSPFLKDNPRIGRAGYLRKLIGSVSRDLGPTPLKPEFWDFSLPFIDLCGDPESCGVNADVSFQGSDSYKRKGSGNATSHTKGTGRGDQKRKRGVDEDEENEDSNPPPSKRIDRDGPGASSLRQPLACPFAKADRNEHAGCIFIRRKNLSGIKEHLKRNHFDGALPNDIRAARSWNEVFDICNPEWHPTRRPSPYLEAVSRRSLASSSKSSASSIISNPPENSSALQTPVDIGYQNTYDGAELRSPPLSNDAVSPKPGNGVVENSRAGWHRETSVVPCSNNVGYRRHARTVGALSPTSCGRGSHRGSFSAPVEDSTTNPPTASWPIANTEPHAAQRSFLESRNVLGQNWASTNVSAEVNNQDTFFHHEFGVANGNPTGNVHDIMPPLIDTVDESGYETTVDPSHLEYPNFFSSGLAHGVPVPWVENNPMLQTTGGFKRTPPTPAAILNKGQDSLKSSLDITVLQSQQTAKSKPEEVEDPASQSNGDRQNRKKYLLIVTRMPPNPASEESRRPHKFTFESPNEFHLQFDHWLRREFTDPPFSWKTMMLFNGLEGARLESVEEVADNLEQSFIQYRSSDAALYLVSRNSHLEPYRPVGLTNANFNSPEALFHRQ
ncbi:hypothetical protein TWF481_001355 [Arthrobotrys musiformis]|uniref:Uncharacterized protein n=1 Tax=Arthrobotrys musiformis TaxID=47236 RepID=A0AAV9WRB5_9PEZI